MVGVYRGNMPSVKSYWDVPKLLLENCDLTLVVAARENNADPVAPLKYRTGRKGNPLVSLFS